MRTPLGDRFWVRVNRDGDGCWLWTGPPAPNGYAQAWSGTAQAYVHHLALTLVGVVIPKGLVVGHTCDERICVRNDDVGVYRVRGVNLPRWGHLFLGTQADNIADMIAKGRMAPPAQHRPKHPARGEANSQAKLTRTDVDEIRVRYRAGGIHQTDLAKMYKVSFQLIHLIVRDKIWTT